MLREEENEGSEGTSRLLQSLRQNKSTYTELVPFFQDQLGFPMQRGNRPTCPLLVQSVLLVTQTPMNYYVVRYLLSQTGVPWRTPSASLFSPHAESEVLPLSLLK